MKLDTKHPDTRIILSERFRSRQEVMDHGFQIVGNGITFPGDGVKFTGAAGQRLVLAQSPSKSLMLTAFSAQVCFTPAWDVNEVAANSYVLWDQEPNIGYAGFSIWANLCPYSAPGDVYKCSSNAATTRAAWKQYTKNCLSYSITNGTQRAWLNGVQIATASISPMPAATSNIARGLNIGCNGSATGYTSVFNGTIHSIDWLSTTTTLEDHLDFMHNDTFSEVF